MKIIETIKEVARRIEFIVLFKVAEISLKMMARKVEEIDAGLKRIQEGYANIEKNLNDAIAEYCGFIDIPDDVYEDDIYF